MCVCLTRVQGHGKGCCERLQGTSSGLMSQVLLSVSPLRISKTQCALLTTHHHVSVLVQVRHVCRRPSHSTWTCRATVAPTIRTNGAALDTGKPVLDNPLWRDTLQADSPNTAAQLYRQPKGMLPNRLRLFAGTANPVCQLLHYICVLRVGPCLHITLALLIAQQHKQCFVCAATAGVVVEVIAAINSLFSFVSRACGQHPHIIQALAHEVACYLGLDLGGIKIKRFADGEIYVQVQARHQT